MADGPQVGPRTTVPTIQRPRAKVPQNTHLGIELEASKPGSTSTLGPSGSGWGTLTGKERRSSAGDAYSDLHSAAGTHEDKIWYHGELSRNEAAERLMNSTGRGSMQRDGYFLVRKGSAGLVLSILIHADVKHLVIREHARDGISSYSIDDGPRLPSVPGLISFYRYSSKKKLLPFNLSAHCPNKSIATPHIMFGKYKVAWMAVGKEEDAATLKAEIECAQCIYEEVKADMEEAVKPTAPKNLFAAAARAIAGAKRISWDARAKAIKASMRPEELAPEKPFDPRTARSDRFRQTMKQSNAVEMRMNLAWLNQKIGKDSSKSEDFTKKDLRSGTIMIQLIHTLTGCSKPMHKETPSSDIQMEDNWHAILKYMRRARIPVADLDASALYRLDERMLLKLFALLMGWETSTLARRESVDVE